MAFCQKLFSDPLWCSVKMVSLNYINSQRNLIEKVGEKFLSVFLSFGKKENILTAFENYIWNSQLLFPRKYKQTKNSTKFDIIWISVKEVQKCICAL